MVVSKSARRVPASNPMATMSRRWPVAASPCVLFICCLLLTSCGTTDQSGARSLTDSDNEATLEASGILVKDGFHVLPYCTDDVVLCKKLEDLGCSAVMPLAAPIGSGLGIRNPYNIKLILEAVKIPVIIDAGVGTASDASRAMELGVDGLLMNTAIAGADDPLKMAQAMRLAVESGRMAYEAGRIPKKLYATASSPLDGLIDV